ncbi:hypothetical protein NDU88_001319 [Pleurodeles waltl]|uniref:Uncharacterized protein n=1 Tax=Pleurodeles waltl TaxID=8319 RepID=A0AAV7WLF2_PLEWA|nr:hypothetical protein NDU88_001319 [Pleurodeles waltl]
MNQAKCLQGPPPRSSSKWVRQTLSADLARHHDPQSTTARLNSRAPRSQLEHSSTFLWIPSLHAATPAGSGGQNGSDSDQCTGY